METNRMYLPLLSFPAEREKKETISREEGCMSPDFDRGGGSEGGILDVANERAQWRGPSKKRRNPLFFYFSFFTYSMWVLLEVKKKTILFLFLFLIERVSGRFIVRKKSEVFSFSFSFCFSFLYTVRERVTCERV